MLHFVKIYISIESSQPLSPALESIIEDGCDHEGYDYEEIEVDDGSNAGFAFSAVKRE